MLVLPDASYLDNADSGFSLHRTHRPAREAKSRAALTGNAKASAGKNPANACISKPERHTVNAISALLFIPDP